MKRILSIAAAAALLVTLLPIGAVAAHDNNGQGNGRHGDRHSHKVTICHKGVTITVAKKSWTLKGHLKHGDFIVTPTTPCVPKPKPPKPAQTVCTFVGTANYSGTNGTSSGPITFSYSQPTASTAGVVKPGGTWTEGAIVDTITGGSVPFSGTGVNLKFNRSGSPIFEFNGNLASNNLTGALVSPPGSPAWPTNTFVTTGGSVTCTQATAAHHHGG